MAPSDEHYHGVLLLYKPGGITSHEAVAQVRRIIDQKRIGHTGTLDPLAEGLLVLCLGRATKIARFISEQSKVYEAQICLGRKSTTFDAEGVDTEKPPAPLPELEKEQLVLFLDRYKGRIKQKVPPFSAVRVAGRRLYRLARNGVPVETPEREVEIIYLQLLEFTKPYLHLRIKCSSGTYIRSLADDIGNQLGCGAYLSGLRRLAVGDLQVERALTLDEVQRHEKANSLADFLLSFQDVLPYKAVTVNNRFKDFIIQGRPLTATHILRLNGRFNAGERILMTDVNGRVLAVGTADVASHEFANRKQCKLFSYLRVLN